jgi:ABC-type bacteriocin/lantibiotic exporter with double-glycine peptidase domain
MQMKYEYLTSARPPSLLHKVAALIVTATLVGLVLMFSVVLFAIIVVVGMIAWAYLWWRTRELRKQMRDFVPPPGAEQEQKVGEEEVFEGEVIRVVEPRNEK